MSDGRITPSDDQRYPVVPSRGFSRRTPSSTSLDSFDPPNVIKNLASRSNTSESPPLSGRVTLGSPESPLDSELVSDGVSIKKVPPNLPTLKESMVQVGEDFPRNVPTKLFTFEGFDHSCHGKGDHAKSLEAFFNKIGITEKERNSPIALPKALERKGVKKEHIDMYVAAYFPKTSRLDWVKSMLPEVDIEKLKSRGINQDVVMLLQSKGFTREMTALILKELHPSDGEKIDEELVKDEAGKGFAENLQKIYEALETHLIPEISGFSKLSVPDAVHWLINRQFPKTVISFVLTPLFKFHDGFNPMEQALPIRQIAEEQEKIGVLEQYQLGLSPHVAFEEKLFIRDMRQMGLLTREEGDTEAISALQRELHADPTFSALEDREALEISTALTQALILERKGFSKEEVASIMQTMHGAGMEYYRTLHGLGLNHEKIEKAMALCSQTFFGTVMADYNQHLVKDNDRSLGGISSGDTAWKKFFQDNPELYSLRMIYKNGTFHLHGEAILRIAPMEDLETTVGYVKLTADLDPLAEDPQILVTTEEHFL